MLPCIVGTPPNDIKSEIGKIISTRLVNDEATLHLGIESFMTLRIIILSCVSINNISLLICSDTGFEVHRMTAINFCIEMDVTDQICSDNLRIKIYSGHCLPFTKLAITRSAAQL
ncbi:hypothetical protein TSAR_003469 [Trichomalopsis sarcophagae]|uniref:Uncharacterized protein n=1 Tax=Trichomalopsis sarcophagae TaxID=543379 RepID=A0A232EHE9_9HYME|nr:hypothetical protein TSAR_003469 [Trichomalopsis sarcophagae]